MHRSCAMQQGSWAKLLRSRDARPAPARRSFLLGIRSIFNMATSRLNFEPVPARSRLATLAKLLPPNDWNLLRRGTYRRAGYRCEACGNRGRLNCHEVWQFLPESRRQVLAGLRCLCDKCHRATHLTIVHDDTEREALLVHVAQVNRLSREEAEQLFRQALAWQREVDRREWIVDLGPFNAQMPVLKTVEQRRTYAKALRPTYHRPESLTLMSGASDSWDG